MNIEILLGKTNEHLVEVEGTKHFVHKLMLQDFLKLQRDAKSEGFDLKIISSFRTRERQLKIWNEKARGERPLLDDQGKVLNFADLSPTEIMFAILRWSALPGSSRHHWGTDIDVYDEKTQQDKEVQLIPSECEASGPAAPMHEWLEQKILSHNSHGFYRPYSTDRGGVSPERWHLSYAPVARRMIDNYSYSIFKKNIEEQDLVLKKTILENADEIFNKFFLNFDSP